LFAEGTRIVEVNTSTEESTLLLELVDEAGDSWIFTTARHEDCSNYGCLYFDDLHLMGREDEILLLRSLEPFLRHGSNVGSPADVQFLVTLLKSNMLRG